MLAFHLQIHTASSHQAKGWESITVKMTSAHKVSSPRQSVLCPCINTPENKPVTFVRALLTDLSGQQSLMSVTPPVSTHFFSSQPDSVLISAIPYSVPSPELHAPDIGALRQNKSTSNRCTCPKTHPLSWAGGVRSPPRAALPDLLCIARAVKIHLWGWQFGEGSLASPSLISCTAPQGPLRNVYFITSKWPCKHPQEFADKVDTPKATY